MASRTQARLIDDLLDVTRIVTGKLALDRILIDVTDAIRGAIEVIHPAARAASIASTPTSATAPPSSPATPRACSR